MAIQYNKPRKRKAYLVEPYQGPKPIITTAFKCLTDARHQYERKEKNIYCYFCDKPAEFKAYFQTQGVTLIEKYCSQCLDKFVIVDQSVPIIGK